MIWVLKAESCQSEREEEGSPGRGGVKVSQAEKARRAPGGAGAGRWLGVSSQLPRTLPVLNLIQRAWESGRTWAPALENPRRLLRETRRGRQVGGGQVRVHR